MRKQIVTMPTVDRINCKGFTLIEVLIAITLSTMVLLILAGGMYAVSQDWNRSNNRLEENLEVTLALLQLERALTGAFAHTYLKENENKRHILFEGDTEQILWVSTVSAQRQPGLSVWSLSTEDVKSGLEMRVVPAFASDPRENLDNQEATLILEDYEVNFEYLYVDTQFEDDTKWMEEWTAEKWQGLPNAVRIQLQHTEDQELSLEVIAMIPAYEHSNIRRLKPL